jgi:hypothetical protein
MIRYMSYNSASRKFDSGAYIAKVRAIERSASTGPTQLPLTPV